MRFKNHLQLLSIIRALKSFFFGLKPVFSWTSINCFHGFLRASLFVFVRGNREDLKEYFLNDYGVSVSLR